MNDAEVVAVLNRADNLLKHVARRVLAELAHLDNVVVQLTAVNILHDQKDILARLQHLVEAANVRVAE